MKAATQSSSCAFGCLRLRSLAADRLWPRDELSLRPGRINHRVARPCLALPCLAARESPRVSPALLRAAACSPRPVSGGNGLALNFRTCLGHDIWRPLKLLFVFKALSSFSSRHRLRSGTNFEESPSGSWEPPLEIKAKLLPRELCVSLRPATATRPAPPSCGIQSSFALRPIRSVPPFRPLRPARRERRRYVDAAPGAGLGRA